MSKPKPGTTAAADDFMATLEHPLKAEIEDLHRLVVSVDPSVTEGVKWNAPGLRSTEDFANVRRRAMGGEAPVLHLSATSVLVACVGVRVMVFAGIVCMG